MESCSKERAPLVEKLPQQCCDETPGPHMKLIWLLKCCACSEVSQASWLKMYTEQASIVYPDRMSSDPQEQTLLWAQFLLQQCFSQWLSAENPLAFWGMLALIKRATNCQPTDPFFCQTSQTRHLCIWTSQLNQSHEFSGPLELPPPLQSNHESHKQYEAVCQLCLSLHVFLL